MLTGNHSGGHLADLFEAFIQSAQSSAAQFWRILAGIEPMPAAFRDKLLEITRAIERADLVGGQDIQGQVSAYKKDILEGRKVVLVAHSQGNFFGNAASARLSPTELASFGMIGVANPDNFVRAGGPHVTSVTDLVIQAVRAANLIRGVPLPQPSNVNNGFSLVDKSGHQFVKSYMRRGAPSREMIVAEVRRVQRSLQDPPDTGGDGIITVTLTWGAQPDVDLHAFEPGGSHVYYAAKQGQSGFLDVDDVTSFGPEHYIVGCDTVQTGTYRIGVNYFRGDAPETARTHIQAGLNTGDFTTLLPHAVGSAGDSSPVPVASIKVEGNEEDGFNFTITASGVAGQRSARRAAEEMARETQPRAQLYRK